MTKYKQVVKELEKRLKDAEAKIPHGEELVETIVNTLGKSEAIVEAAIHIGLIKLSMDAKLNPLWGSIGLKLATTQSDGSAIKAGLSVGGVEIPVNSQIVGIGMLASLGLCWSIDQMGDVVKIGAKDIWESYGDNCDKKREYANFLKYRQHVNTEDSGWAFIIGWYDKQLFPLIYGEKYVECKKAKGEPIP